MKVIKNILFWVATISLVIAIALVALTRLGGVEFRAVATGSMTPEIPVGSLVVVVPTAAENIQIGDDITFVTKGDIVVTHRVVAIDREKNEFTTWGIANARSAVDAPSRYENIIGVVKLHIPGAGMLLVWLSTLQAKILVATGIVALYLLYCIVRIVGRKDEPINANENNKPSSDA
ncbi:MAG: signal peptidase I [Eggerthellaceae bacterium]|nr:signal peptidase I [Eggerthellaceae bacterium]